MVLKKIKQPASAKGSGEAREQKTLRTEVKERTVGYILAAFGLVAGLAWNDAIKSLIDTLIKQPGNSILIKFLYAIGVTVVIVIITVYLVKLIEKK